ncbi:hypothetical protein [Limnohabitans sp. JirII-29]|uniref:hypothetical protein n=1 Tax=Limnohabitans sp. JirII-29 TaxID=1835756 RepID=UPI001304A719|nr:hypothetical protein [Limnohabitans sp. JirII-29]
MTVVQHQTGEERIACERLAFFRPLKSLALTVAEALTSVPMSWRSGDPSRKST